MSRIGVPWGGSSGKAVREQADRIARCRLTFHVQGQGRAALVNQNIVDRADWARVRVRWHQRVPRTPEPRDSEAVGGFL